MYIANRRDSSKFNGCSPLQLYLGLIGLKHAIAYLPYTNRWAQLNNDGNINIHMGSR
ncbi:hypothetical protein L21SP5_03783 [Salinivirga cyanobacteriivorans]|uniref:Uncharacterized protein n=1 Tax=Salinivirga cyanobacteriivorans TaxID=1307839 RepID=A0A0S2I553_9BACT|nr:hypothetical protein L21SP5_03783 [Salinivirga cyanobacteriivorans]